MSLKFHCEVHSFDPMFVRCAVRNDKQNVVYHVCVTLSCYIYLRFSFVCIHNIGYLQSLVKTIYDCLC
jgi:hypothetical protein